MRDLVFPLLDACAGNVEFDIDSEIMERPLFKLSFVLDYGFE